MRLEQSKFLGTTSHKFDAEAYVLSLIDFQTSAPEDWHYHENTHISLVLQGGSKESRKGEDFQLTPGKLILYNEGEFHCNRHTAFPSKHLILEFKKDFFTKNELEYNYFTAPSVENVDVCLSVLNIYNELRLGDAYTAESIDFSVNQLLKSNDESSYIPAWIKHLREIIEDRWDEFIPLNELAKTFNVHPVTISKYFRKYYKCTLGDYMRKIKIDKAIFLIINTSKPITEISDICGFSDQSHMIKVFKAYIGFLPNQLRSL